MVHIASGTGYWLQEQSRRELESGGVLLVVGDAPGRILASCLNGMALHYFTMMPERLTGLITQGEQDFFRQAAERRQHYQLLPPSHTVAGRMKLLSVGRNPGSLLARLQLLQLLVEAFDIEVAQPAPRVNQADVKDRLRQFLRESPPAALLEISFDDLAQITHCTPRHLSRVFYDVVGMSFRDKRAEIRLARARELLATSQSKVVDVAFKSGYKSLSLFNRIFTKRFGISPGRWRQKNSDIKSVSRQRNGKSRLAANQNRLMGV
jgi:AraC-like DNA-binding protein